MATRPSSRKTEVTERTRRRLTSYAATAGAACAGLLTAAGPASAKVVYTPASVPFKPGESYRLDVDHNGVIDFLISDWYVSAVQLGGLTVMPNNFGGRDGDFYDAVVANRQLYALDLPPGSIISRKRYFRGLPPSSYPMCMAVASAGGQRCDFVDVTNRYVGLKFVINNQYHYGWARFSVLVDQKTFEIHAQLTGYAFETERNAPILAGQTSGDFAAPVFGGAPEPSEIGPGTREDGEPISETLRPRSLGLLALGAPGLRAGAKPN